MKKLSDLLDGDINVVQKRKLIFLIPLCIVALAVILCIVFNFTLHAPLNLGMDFAGGYTINVDVGANLTASNTREYRQRVNDIVEEYAKENNSRISISQFREVGTEDNKSLQVGFKSVAGDEEMEKMIDDLIVRIKDYCAKIRPTITREGSVVTATYGRPLDQYRTDLTSIIGKVEGASGIDFGEQYSKSVKFNYSGSLDDDALIDAISIDDELAAQVYTSGKVGATVSQDLLYNAISAILIALVLMLIYIIIRFEYRSGIATIVALIHDILMMFAFMIIFHVEFNSTFIAALITILGYSINNSIIVFDRVRGNVRVNPSWDDIKIANKSIGGSFVRCLNTTITTIIMIGMVAIVCAIASIFNPDLYQMVTFSLPIIVGLLSGFYSSMLIAPAVWSSLSGGRKSAKKSRVAEVKE